MGGGLDRRKFLGVAGKGLGAAAAVGAGMAASPAAAQSLKRKQEPRLRESRERENTTTRFVSDLAKEFAKLDGTKGIEALPRVVSEMAAAYFMAFARKQDVPEELRAPDIDAHALGIALYEAGRRRADPRMLEYLVRAFDEAQSEVVRERLQRDNPGVGYDADPFLIRDA